MWTAVRTGWQALRRFRAGELARQQAQRVQRALELDVLRGRLNPHFVFNALNNLRALILEDPTRARELVTRLSSTLRHALEHSPRQRVTLASELEVVADYLAVEAVHFEERLQVIQDIEPAATDALLPAMLLQLLVENAIKHGIAVTPGGGQLRINARIVGDELQLQVSNPGQLATTRSSAGTGIGLEYLRAQLAQHSPRARFELTAESGRVNAVLMIPQGESDAHTDRG
jgi:LytS/YehU family sensor histidine kinase